MHSLAGFAILHDKPWVVDGRWVCTGSLNLSNNGFLNNSENLVEIDIAHFVIDAMSRIDSLYSRAELVTEKYLDERLREQLQRGGRGSRRGVSVLFVQARHYLCMETTQWDNVPWTSLSESVICYVERVREQLQR